MKTSKKLQEKLLRLAIEKYVEWLNLPEHELDEPYTTEQFLVNDPKCHLFGASGVLSCTQGASCDYVLHISAYDGDEGGASDLIATFDEDGFNTGIYELTSLTQGFDCSIDMIYRDERFGSFGKD